MSLARGGQTLLSEAARQALQPPAGAEIQRHGHYRAKGLAEPIEIFELGLAGSAFIPALARRVFGLRMFAVKNSMKRLPASDASGKGASGTESLVGLFVNAPAMAPAR